MADFGDIVQGRVVDAEYRLKRPARTVMGTVIGVLALDPRHVTVLVGTSERVTVRVMQP